MLRAFTPPSITVHYSFDDAGLTAERDERLVDMKYQSRSPLYATSDRLRYEKTMLDDWFEARFVKGATAFVVRAECLRAECHAQDDGGFICDCR